MIIKSNVFDKINNYMSIGILKQWFDSDILYSLDSKMWTAVFTACRFFSMSAMSVAM